MPELPEVEHARRCLDRWTRGATLTRVIVYDARIVDAPRRGVRVLEGARVREVERRGKWIRLTLDRALLFSHLGMTGKWLRRGLDEPPARSERLRFDVTRARPRAAVSVRYVDPRLFGRFVVAEHDIAEWNALGPDPLVDGIDEARLHDELARRKLPIKAALLDQRLLAGIGNIQATEALFSAGLDPRVSARTLTRRDVDVLAVALRRSIRRTLDIQEREGEVIEYVEEAGAENPFSIYGREGEPCPRCNRPLDKMVLAGRGTVFCPRCQQAHAARITSEAAKPRGRGPRAKRPASATSR